MILVAFPAVQMACFETNESHHQIDMIETHANAAAASYLGQGRSPVHLASPSLPTFPADSLHLSWGGEGADKWWEAFS